MKFFGSLMLALIITAVAYGDPSTQSPKQRSFRLRYGAGVERLDAGTKLRIWLPVPRSDSAQETQIVNLSLPTADLQRTRNPRYENAIIYFEHTVPSEGRFDFSIDYAITRREVRTLDGTAKKEKPTPLTAKQKSLFLAANKQVPIAGRPLTLLPDFHDSSNLLLMARLLYDRVDSHVRYDKSEPGYGNGDVLWVCDSQFGNCTDFHSLFISFARSQQIPARFEIGFPLPPERGKGKIGGYHCWAFFHTDELGWVPVDISEADKHPEMKDYYFGNLTENRVAFSTGRDIQLVPRQSGPPLNYFVYPYIEADGKPLRKDHVNLQFEFEDDDQSGDVRGR